MIPSPRLARSWFVLATLAAASWAVAQSPVEFPAASPASTLKQRVGLTDVEVVYARPSIKDRSIFGGIVAYDAVWRTGANAATRITFSTPVTFGGTELPAGTYLLFSIPKRQGDWTVIVQQDARAWGSSAYNPENDVARVNGRVTNLASPVETFTIDLNDLRDESASLTLTWDRTRVSVPIRVSVVAEVMPKIEQALAGDGQKPAGLLFQSANFYLEHGGDLNRAAKWIEQALTQQPEAYWIAHVQAKILAKLGRKPEAIAAANRSKELATAAEGPSSGYVKQNDDLIAGLK